MVRPPRPICESLMPSGSKLSSNLLELEPCFRLAPSPIMQDPSNEGTAVDELSVTMGLAQGVGHDHVRVAFVDSAVAFPYFYP